MVERYDNQVRVGGSGRVVFQVRSPGAIRLKTVEADLIGDLRPGWSVDAGAGDANRVAGIRYFPRVLGTYNLVVRVADANGCAGQTGVQRFVTVVP
jgi:hypothetical protein